MATRLADAPESRGTPLDKAKDPSLRGDRISGDRYVSREFFEREWETMWSRTWHIGGLAYQVPEPGDYVTTELGPESILMVRQQDGSIKAFYNICLHRGNVLVHNPEGGVDTFNCAYHGWQWGADGVLLDAQDADDFPQGNPCGKLKLKELRCEVWAGFIWFNMDPDCVPLRTYLDPVAEHLDCYHMEDMVRVLNMTARTNCNWKVICDNFNEGYHINTLHPQITPYIENHPDSTQYDLYEAGHNRGWFPGARPARSYTRDELDPGLAWIAQSWDLDPADYHGRARQDELRAAVQRQKRKLGPGRGYNHYRDLADYQLTDFLIYNVFPNPSITMLPDGVQILRPRPHPDDPNKCYFDHWYLVPRVEGIDKVPSPAGGPDLPVEDAPQEVVDYGEKTLGTVADQDLSIATSQQRGFRSRAYQDAYLSNQERRVRRFHEVLNDYLEGRR